MKKLFVMMIALMFSGALAMGCSSDESAEGTEVSSGSEYTEDQWGNAEQSQEATEGAEEAAEDTAEAAEESAEEAEESAEDITEEETK